MADFLHTIAVGTLPLLPRPIMRFLASRYIAGETLEEALSCLRLNQSRGYDGILDILGEEIASEEEARAVAASYRQAATAIAEAKLAAYVSVKPTHVGILISEELAYELYAELVRHCDPLGIFVRVEMEDHTTTDATLRVFERLRPLSERVGIVLQSRLFRTPADIDAFAPGRLDVRMVKGVYLEPPEIAHVEREPIRRAFVAQTRQLLERGASVSLATHDDLLAEQCLEVCRELDVSKDRYEFQVLLGVRERLWRAWQEAGHRVRVYVPYGPDWRAYSTRRLKKNPEIFRHLVRDLVRRR